MPIEIVYGDEGTGDVSSKLILIPPFFLIVGLVVILGEKSYAWRMLNRQEFLPLGGLEVIWGQGFGGFKEGEGNRVLGRERTMDRWVMERDNGGI